MEIALVQVASSLDPAQNIAALADLPDAELVVLPEAYARDFGKPGSEISAFAEDLDGPFVNALISAAGDRTIIAGMFERSPDRSRPFNTLVAVNGEGVLASYRKIHLYDSFGYQESLALMAGDVDQKVIVEVGGVSLGLLTCYDLRFPELARRYAGDVDLLVIPAAWVAGPRKVDHWRTLVIARAIENLSYVAAVGQAGPRYTGHSMLVDPRGDVVVEAGTDAQVVTGTVDRELLDQARRENPSLSNRRL